MARVLLVEDDRTLASGLITLIKNSGFAIDAVRSGEEALEVAEAEPYNLIICDVGLPGMSGFETIRHLRARGATVPVLFLTARHEREDRIQGFDLGGDDYLGKPFDADELLAHIRALVRRSAGSASPLLRVGQLICDFSATSATVADRPLVLPRREWSVLWALASRAGKVVPKDRLLSEVFDYDDPVGSNAVEVYITRLRKKLAPDGPKITSLRGLGYMMDVS
ncbi:response regulator transcription factor [Novosphingobium humi]|uniref:Response regulator transcription factor n=1 Tax=Novosphingobium humi TaxID=2282397 RepID=A0ABY7U162_9SPHN|nr:response regulator transcription factor [Novosphingobium humi]WCT79264.1 response regulator transcription factor [Novosphingobium humi]